MNKLSQAALLFVALSSDNQVSAFLPNFFGGNKKNENKVEARNNKNDNGMGDLFGDFMYNNDSTIKQSVKTLAFKAIAEEAEKFEEALLAVMSQRVQEYLQVKLGAVDEAKLKKIVQMQQFKEILAENLEEFRIFYSKEVSKRVNSFADNAISEYFNNLTAGDWTTTKMNKSDQQIAYEIVEKLNTEIFNKTMNQIKQMMTIAIMETQALLDKIDINTNSLRFKSEFIN